MMAPEEVESCRRMCRRLQELQEVLSRLNVTAGRTGSAMSKFGVEMAKAVKKTNDGICVEWRSATKNLCLGSSGIVVRCARKRFARWVAAATRRLISKRPLSRRRCGERLKRIPSRSVSVRVNVIGLGG